MVSGDKWVGTENTVRVDESHWDVDFLILYCFNNNVTQILDYSTSHLSVLDYGNPQEKRDEHLHTTCLLDFVTCTWPEQKLDIPWHVGICPNGYRN